MPYEKHQEKQYPSDLAATYRAVLAASAKLSGHTVSSDPAKGHLVVKFPKTILGQVLGERTHLTCDVRTVGDATMVVVDAYPLDAVEQKLMFGARKGVTQAVVDLFLGSLDEQCR
jgi:hypothetical protein